LEESATEEFVRAAFIPFGDLVSVNLPTDQNNRKSRGFAFVEFEETEDALAALDNMHHAELLGKVITCTIAKPTPTASLSKPVWEDESYLQQLEQEGKAVEDETDEKIPGSKVLESSVLINTPKRPKPEEQPAKLPPGMVRCKQCSGFGKDLVKDHGYCEHCFSKMMQT